MPRIGDRLAALERRRGGEITVILIEGGLPEGIGNQVIAGWRPLPPRGDDEPFAAYKDRVVVTAKAAGEAFVVIGGLPEPGASGRLI